MLFSGDGKLLDRDGLRSVAVGLTVRGRLAPHVDDQGRKHVPVEHEAGGVAGEQIHHADGRISSNVFARGIEVGRDGSSK